ncbi:hypothetical protein BH11ARM2_BH11ARM2_31850 [soil metagenome]
MKTIHIIFSAHIDPVWLWPWQSGLAEVFATCRSACDRLDANPDVFFTRGESWVYEQIERLDPKLFARIRAHIEAGRWEIVGGWTIQPDCNLPSYWAMEKQIEIGRDYFLSRFGFFPRSAFNVDCFGHAAALPGLMNAYGQDSYLVTRPSWEEMEQPGRIFRWRGYEDGPEVIVVHPPFFNSHEFELEGVKEAIERLPEGYEHAICCLGVGDHGGGPTEYQIKWVREHREAIPGWRMEFSTLDRFVEIARQNRDRLPEVVGELQPHAIGCYSVYRPVKVAMRRAEHLLAQAETLGTWDEDIRAALDNGWKRVAFHHFHDTLAGSCTPTAFRAVLDQLGGACAAADEALHYGLRKKIVDLPDDKLQRIVMLNANDVAFDGWVEHEPWVGPWSRRWLKDCYLIDEKEEPVPFQLMDAEPIAFTDRQDTVLPRILFPAKLGPGELRVVRIARGDPLTTPKSCVKVDANETITSDSGARWSMEGFSWNDGPRFPIRLDLIRDMSDTWSHGLFRYSEEPVEHATWGDPIIVDSGPLMASAIVEGSIGHSKLKAEWRVYAGEPFVELKLDIHWQERFRVLKLTLPTPSPSPTRLDGVMGTNLLRKNDGNELPMRDWTLLGDASSAQLGVVAPDVYGLDARPERARLTLLRSPMMAQHDPAPALAPRAVISDQGTHTFRFRFFYGEGLSVEELDRHASTMQRPLVVTDATGGMPTLV